MTNEPLKTSDAAAQNVPQTQSVDVEETTQTPTVAAGVEVLSSEDDPLRRRRRRRRRRSVDKDVPQRRVQIFLLCIVIVLMALALMGSENLPKFWGPDPNYVATGNPGDAPPPPAKNFPFNLKRPPFEIIALGVAALLLVYQIPGVEDKIMRALGLKKDRRR